MKALLAACVLVVAVPATAHQPVMDMAPRWAEGYGFQIRQEHFGSNDLMRGSDDIPNTLDIDRYVDTTWLEGVYTFKRSIRATIKIPYIDQRRTATINSVAVRQQNSGLGDVVLGAGAETQRQGDLGEAKAGVHDDPEVAVDGVDALQVEQEIGVGGGEAGAAHVDARAEAGGQANVARLDGAAEGGGRAQ